MMTNAERRPNTPRQPSKNGSRLSVLLVLDDGVSESERAVTHRWWTDIAWSLVEEGLLVSIATTGTPTGWHGSLGRLGIPAVALQRSRRSDLLGPVGRLVRYLKQTRFDVVYGHEMLPAIISSTAGRLARTESLRLYHRHHTATNTRRGVLVGQLAARLADYTVVFSEAAAQSARRVDRTPPARVVQVQPGVRRPTMPGRDVIHSLRDRLGIPTHCVVIGCVSRLRSEKGVDLFVRSVAELHTRANVRAVVVGSGPEGSSLEALARNIGADVKFVGHQDDPSVWYELFDIVVVPSRRESLGLVALEAMSHGKPVVASRVGGLKEIVLHGMTGLFFDDRDSESLAATIDRLVMSAPLRHELGGAARSFVQSEFSMQGMARSWRRTFEGLCAGRR